jgi:hypothetical protein
MKKIILCFSMLIIVSHLMGQEIKLSLGPTYNYEFKNKEAHIGTSEVPILIGFNTNLDLYIRIRKTIAIWIWIWL